MEFEIKKYYNGSYFGIRYYSIPLKISPKIISQFEDRILDLGRKKLGRPLMFARFLKRVQPKLINVDFTGLNRRYMIRVFIQYMSQIAKYRDYMHRSIIMKIIDQTVNPKKVLKEYFVFCGKIYNLVLNLPYENMSDDIIEWFVMEFPPNFFTLRLIGLSQYIPKKKHILGKLHLRCPEKITVNGILNAVEEFYGVPKYILDILQSNYMVLDDLRL
jgi:hypothetical protein